MSWISEALHLASTYSNNGDFQKSYLTYITLIENLCTKLKGWNIGSNENLTINDMMFLFQVLNQALENAKTIYCDHNQNAKIINQTQINNPLYPLAHLSNVSSAPPVAPPKASSRPRSNSNVVRTLPNSPQVSPKNAPVTLLSESEESLRANNLQITETKSSPIIRDLSKNKDIPRSDKSSFINNIKARFEAHLNSEKTITYSLSKSDSQTGFRVEEVIKTSPVLDHSPDHRLSTDSIKLTVSSLSEDDDDDISSNQDSEHQPGTISTPPQNSSPLSRFSLEDVDLNFLVNPKSLKPLSVNSNISIPSIPKSPLIVITQTANEKLNLTKMRAVDPSYQTTTTSPDSSPQLFEELSQTFLIATSTLERVSRLRRIERSGTFLSFPPGIIAYQLTLIESELFFRISLDDLLQHSPNSPNPRVTASTDFFNYFTRVIEISILSYSHPTERAVVIHFWIKVAIKLHQLLNFQTLKAVLSALGTPPIQRLRKTWNEVNKKDISRLSSLKTLMSEDSNYEQYRKAASVYEADLLKLVAYSPSPNPTHLVPILPYMGVFIMDLTYLNAASKRRSTIITNEPTSVLSNSEQRKQDVITKFQAYQYAPRYFPAPPHNFIKTHKKGTSFTSFSFPFGKSNSINNSSQNPLPLALAPPLDNLLSPFNEKQNHVSLKRPLKDPEMMANMQYMATHLILSQAWAPEKVVDEMSRDLEKAGTSDSLVTDHATQSQPEEDSNSRLSESKPRHRRGSSGGFVNPPQFGSILEHELYPNVNISRSETEDSEGPLDVSIPNSRISLMLPLQSPSNDRQHY